MCHYELLSLAHQELMHFKDERAEAEIKTFCPSWQSFRPEPPRLMKKQKANDVGKDDLSDENPDEILGRPVSSPKGLLRLKYTGPSSGWTLALTKDVSVGEYFLMDGYRNKNAPRLLPVKPLLQLKF